MDNSYALLWSSSHRNNENNRRMEFKSLQSRNSRIYKKNWTFQKIKKIAVFQKKNRCPPTPKPVCGGNFSHEAVTLKIRLRSPKSNKLLILSDLYRLAFGKIPSNGPWDNMQTLFGLILVDWAWQWPWKLDQGHLNLFSFLSSPNVISLQIWLKSASWFMRNCAHKHILAQIWRF